MLLPGPCLVLVLWLLLLPLCLTLQPSRALSTFVSLSTVNHPPPIPHLLGHALSVINCANQAALGQHTVLSVGIIERLSPGLLLGIIAVLYA